MFESQRNILITIVIFALIILCGGSIWLAANMIGRESETTAVPTPTPDAYPGLLILSVAPDSPAAVGGLQSAHILLQVDGTPVNTPDELQAVLTLKTAGDTTTLIMLVDGEMQQTAVIHPSEPPYL
ncbi:MAG: PDZ domain-containing protein, partial [Chloroflexi bacterium]|nr:PDZ domain-containing protein [Chloroflexota bacterium]